VTAIAPIAAGADAGDRRPTARATAVRVSAALATTLLLAAPAANAQTGRAVPDRLRITATRDPTSPADVAIVTAAGTVGRRGDADATTLAVDLYAGTVIVSAIPRGRRCPSSPPAAANGPHTDYDNVYEAHYHETLGILDAFHVARKLRICGYLTAKRRTAAGVRTETVARAVTTVAGTAPEKSSGGGDDLELILGGIMAWVLVIGLVAGLMRFGGWLLDDTPVAPVTRRHNRFHQPGSSATSPHPTARPASPVVPATPTPAAPAAHLAAPQAQPEHSRRRAKPRDVIQDAVDAVADTYRDRLRQVLEQRDGPNWLDALNHRRHISMTLDGKPAPRPYEFLEPRAVLNCLAYDPAGQQLIPAAATTKAKQLSGLVNDAHHPNPHTPLTEADGYRAWQLCIDITDQVPVGDPFDR
jgi:hypothetical protein